ncbi:UvrABC system protein A, partial [Fagus crenata]
MGSSRSASSEISTFACTHSRRYAAYIAEEEQMRQVTDKLVERTNMVATVTTASYFLLTADYGFEPNALDPDCLLRNLVFRYGTTPKVA